MPCHDKARQGCGTAPPRGESLPLYHPSGLSLPATSVLGQTPPSAMLDRETRLGNRRARSGRGCETEHFTSAQDRITAPPLRHIGAQSYAVHTPYMLRTHTHTYLGKAHTQTHPRMAPMGFSPLWLT
jgi:hypothetical protein